MSEDLREVIKKEDERKRQEHEREQARVDDELYRILYGKAPPVVEEVMDYRTYCCGCAKPSAKTQLGFPAETRVNEECKMELPGGCVDFGTLFPLSFQQEIPTRFLH